MLDANAPRPSDTLLTAIRPEARDAPESGIVEVFNYGRGRSAARRVSDGLGAFASSKVAILPLLARALVP